MVFCIPSASRVLMLLSQLERLNEEPKVSDNDAIRQITGKILHLIQTQGDHARTHARTHARACTHTPKRCIHTVRGIITFTQGGLGQNFRLGNLTLIQAIPYTHNNSETWTTLLAYFYDHHIKRSKSLVGVVENN